MRKHYSPQAGWVRCRALEPGSPEAEKHMLKGCPYHEETAKMPEIARVGKPRWKGGYSTREEYLKARAQKKVEARRIARAAAKEEKAVSESSPKPTKKFTPLEEMKAEHPEYPAEFWAKLEKKASYRKAREATLSKKRRKAMVEAREKKYQGYKVPTGDRITARQAEVLKERGTALHTLSVDGEGTFNAKAVLEEAAAGTLSRKEASRYISILMSYRDDE